MRLGMGLTVAFALSIAAGTSAMAATTINGEIYFGGGSTNYYDPANGFVPTGVNNEAGLPVTVDGGTEFGYEDSANLDAADFTSKHLTITDLVFEDAAPWEQRFTASTPGFFNNLTLVSTNFTGLTYSVTGNTLKLNWGGTDSPDLFTADFSFGSAVPEPATWAMLIGGFGLAGGALRRRRATLVAA